MPCGASANKAVPSYPPICRRCDFLRHARPVPGIPVFCTINRKKDVDGRNKSGHDGGERMKTFVVALVVAASVSQASAQTLPGGFAYLRDIDPSIIQDIRYAGVNNFMGRPLAGYGAGECVVKREVGLALKAIQQELARQKLSLKMFDCYRPARASHDMVLWAQNGRGTAAGRRYSPAFSKQELFRAGLNPQP